MASRRIVSTEKTFLDQDDAADVSSGMAPQGSSNIAPAVPAFVYPCPSLPYLLPPLHGHCTPLPFGRCTLKKRKGEALLTARANNAHRAVIYKLLGFTFAMVTMPIGAYFMTVNTVFKGMFQATLPVRLASNRRSRADHCTSQETPHMLVA